MKKYLFILFVIILALSGCQTEINEDWFDSKIKQINEAMIKDYSIIDCSKSENYDKEKILFQIVHICRFSENDFLYGLYNEEVKGIKTQEECQSKNGNWIPYLRRNTEYEMYPSLNEYYFSNILFSLENTGCTKLNLNDYSLKFAIYHNGIKKEEKIDYSVLKWWTYQKYGDEFLFPGKMIFTEASFDKKILAGDNPNNYIFKICLLKENEQIISCDEIHFNMTT